MNILCIMHADFETPGVITDWAFEHKHNFVISKPYQGMQLPVIDPFDMLIIMGGPQSPLQIEQAPYLKDEIMLIKEAILQNKKVIGFCLGAQLIGEALGAQTQRSPEKEIGVFSIILTPEAAHDPLLHNLPKSFPVIHWHNDMPGLTENAVVLAHSLGCPRQIVRYQPFVYGFQCHLEITLEGIKNLISAVPDDLKPSLFTQSKESLLEQNYAQINKMMCEFLNKFIHLK